MRKLRAVTGAVLLTATVGAQSAYATFCETVNTTPVSCPDYQERRMEDMHCDGGSGNYAEVVTVCDRSSESGGGWVCNPLVSYNIYLPECAIKSREGKTAKNKKHSALFEAECGDYITTGACALTEESSEITTTYYSWKGPSSAEMPAQANGGNSRRAKLKNHCDVDSCGEAMTATGLCQTEGSLEYCSED